MRAVLALVAPAASLAAVAEKPAPTGSPCIRPDTRFEAPNANRSRFGSTSSPCFSAIVRIAP